MEMRYIAFIILAAVILAPEAALAGRLYAEGAPQVLIWNSKDGYEACLAEMKETGKTGPLCAKAIAGAVRQYTGARRISGLFFLKIQVLEGPQVGLIGFVPSQWYIP